MEQIAPDCLAFDEDLSAWIDGELAGSRRAEVDAHLAGCRACSARLEQLRAVDRALRALPAPAAGADLRERLAERLAGARPPAAASRHRPPAHARRRFAPALALPLAVGAALALYLVLRPVRVPEAPSEPVPIARAPERPDAPEPRIASAPPDLPPAAAPDAPAPAGPESQLAARSAPAPGDAELDAVDAEDLAIALDLDTIEDLPVIANLEVLERLLAAEAG